MVNVGDILTVLVALVVSMVVCWVIITPFFGER